MYNKTKRGLGLAGAIIAIVAGAFEVVVGLVALITYLPYLNSGYGYEVDNFVVTAILVAVGFVAVGIVKICLGAKLCPQPKKVNGEWEKHMGKNITLIVFMGISFLIYFLSGITSIVILLLLITITGLTLTIVSMCLKAENSSVNNSQVASNPEIFDIDNAVANKINELKRLKELGVITPEQYEMAIDKLLKDSL